jgi:hypothetical protein
VNGALTLAENTNSLGDYVLSNGTLRATQIGRGDGTARFVFDAGQLSFGQFGNVPRPLHLTSAGMLIVTNMTGTAVIHGNYTNASGGALAIHLASTANALVVNGTAKLGGSLQANFFPGFQPVAGQQFALLSADSVVGNFSQVVLPTVSTSGLGLSLSLTTTSIVATVVNYAALLTAPGVSTNGNFQFTVNGLAGQPYTIQTSTNLSTDNWIPVLTNTSPFTFQEPDDMSPQRFYRVIYAP